jgi:hypothetical protein
MTTAVTLNAVSIAIVAGSLIFHIVWGGHHR